MKTLIAEDALIDMVQRGAVYCSNADAAHTFDYPDDSDDIVRAINACGFQELNPDSGEFDDYACAIARLDLFGASIGTHIHCRRLHV